jgi:uncharacterized delta-60 repeat protein
MKKFSILIFFFSFAFQIMQAQPTQQWLNRYNGLGEFSDKFNSVTTDTLNNVYLTGYTFSALNAEDALTIKLNSIGDTIWTRSFNGTANNTDETFDIVIDNAGNVYVTGVTKGAITGKDFITIKYNSAGDTLWTRTYNGTGNGDDDAVAISVDPLGNVFVTGKSDGDLTALINNDFATIKYDSNGNQLWVARYNGLGNATDNAAGLVTDVSGNAYVTGRIFNGFDDDIATIKYDAAGVQQWIMIFNGGSGIDRAYAIAIDAAANIYVGGRSNNGTDDDFITIKYNSSGVQQWLNFYDGGLGNDRVNAIATDQSGNVFVTGRSSNGLTDDYLTIGYNALGAQLWTALWVGPGNGNDVPNAVATDASGNVYVTGLTDSDPTALVNNNYATVKYSSAGVQIWSQTYNGTGNKNDSGNDITIDAAGNVIVAGNCQNTATQKDGTAIKYTPSGNTIWVYNYNGIGDNSDKANAIFVDASGFTYATGSATRAGNGKDFCTIKYNTLGDTTWVRTYNRIGSGNDEANAIAVDALGNVYVTGYTKGTLSKDFTTIKYNSLGDTIWIRNYNGTGNGDDFSVSIKVDASGNVYITGYSDGDATIGINYDYTTIKYNSTGTQLWATRYNGTGNTTDQPIGIVIDGSGNSYVSGRSNNGADDDYRTIKYNSAGVQQWNMALDGGNGDDRATAITIDASANIYVSGRYFNGSDDDFGTVKYNTSGAQQWFSFYDGLIGNDRATAISADPSGNVYVTGQSSTGVTDNFATIKYNSSGTQQWVKAYNGLANGNDVPSSIIVDGAGNVVVAGQSDNGTALLKNNDYEIVKYDNYGTQLWKKAYDGGSSLGPDAISAMTIDNSNNIYVTGVSYSFAGKKDIVTIKYNSPVGINELANENQISVYPNPFSNSATVLIQSLNSFNNQKIAFIMYDLLGKEVSRIDNIQSNEFIITKGELSNGLYLFKIFQNNLIIGSGKIDIK